MPIPPSVYAQEGFRCRLDWGWRGAADAAARGNIVVIVDVLRFSSAMATAAQFGVSVYPCEMQGDVETLARRHGAVAGARSSAGSGDFSLSPASFAGAAEGTKVIIPSPNGATCSTRASNAPQVFAASLLNGSAVAGEVSRLLDGTQLDVTVIACGERWRDENDDGALRFALEDYLGAGAVLARMSQPKSPEAMVCAAAFEDSRDDIASLLWECASGRELREMGREQDVIDCARLDVYDAVPVLRNGWYQRLR